MKHVRSLAILLLGLCPACAYLTDRGVDFLDQYRAVVGTSTGGGIRASALGVYDTGFLFGLKPKVTSFGWKYGRPLLLTATGPGLEVDQSWIVITTSFENWQLASGEYKLARKCLGVLPVFFTWCDSTYRDEPRWYVPEEGVELEGDNYLWTSSTWKYNRYAMIHAFDIEFEIAIVAYLDLGYSPGETLDFFLGFLTIDLAKDDGRIWESAE